jgi:hypothetical protein
MDKATIPAEIYAEMHELMRIGNRAVHQAQEESRKLGVPNVYSLNGILYYELPNGELSRVDPYLKTQSDMTTHVV